MIAAGDGRTTMQSEIYLPPGGTAAAGGLRGRAGLLVANRESMKELTITDYLARRDACCRGRAATATGSSPSTPSAPTSTSSRSAGCSGCCWREVPLGELDLEASEWTPERIRAAEQRQVGTGRHVHTALAIAPDGAVAGSSDVRIDDTDHTHGQVGITLVDPAHRGHRLGLALKLATHDLAVATYPDLVSVDTSNAEVNTYMNAVNEALGYRTIETLLELQKKL